ncbi:DoxX family protein [Geobacillus sp. TFV-3]|uniref:DoxX family protein n=1 Tax=Geobacillus sp. TFV-3 TaxID=1897059 RepID=UPI00387E2B1D
MKWQRGLEEAAESFITMGLPSLLAYIVTIVELTGCWAMMLGLGTRWIAAGFAVMMIGAIVTVKADAGLLGNGRETGYEFNLALLAMSIYLWLNGSRLWSLDTVIGRPRG